ncbi:hypothetical protein [Ruminococcus sp. Marseille-P6503]|uniref:hypothetical protein n=1 Tax=Ruminococcus sp. Marseille-P6503 TaxID=2364796 RepID=UPI000F51E5CA|nr:hypothetical protein [Ruminococcus sp. Marseille-P6503]
MLKDNEIIGWYNGKALTVDENNEISYYEMPEEYAVKGEILNCDDLKHISELPADEVIAIMDHLAQEA